MATVEERVKKVTAKVLDLDPKEIQPEHSFTEDLGAESVQSIELVAMFEEEFGIEMNEDAALSVIDRRRGRRLHRQRMQGTGRGRRIKSTIYIYDLLFAGSRRASANSE